MCFFSCSDITTFSSKFSKFSLYSRLKTESMEREITDLRSKLKECEKERLKAAQYGLQLLERQTELQNQLDKCHEEMMTVTEVGSAHLLTRMCLGIANLFCLTTIYSFSKT